MKGERDQRDAMTTSVHRRRMSLLAKLAVTAAIAACVSPVMAQTANTKTTYTYDALDRLTQVTDPSGLNTTYQYDGLSDPITLTSPDTGVTARTYDAAGNVLTGTDANQNTVTYTYDAQNRRLSASYTDSTQTITYTYDEPNTATGCSTSYPIGHLTHIVENAVTTAFCYNAQGYVTQVSQTVNGTTDVTTYTRSPGGKILSITHPSGDQVTYSYDTDGRVSGVTATTASGTSTLVSNVSYQPFGPISGYTLGNGQAITRTYDANYRLTDLVSPAFTLHVARDAMGDITAIGNSAGANPATETYSYDPLYRLTQITEADGSTLESVTYNPTGDRLSKTGSGLATGTYSYNPNTHQLVATGNAARTVDANGNTTAITQAGSTYGFGYNARNRMTLAQLNQSTVANYTYNAEGERVAKTTNGNTERYNYGPSSQLLSEYGATNREYVYLDGIPVANLDTQGTTSSIAYVTADQLGTPRAISDNNGNTEWSWAYQGNAWGEQSPTSNGYTYNPRFPGQYADAETGLNYNVNRDYDSNVGRYIESDQLGLFGGQASTYAYVDSNPLARSDSKGLACNSLGCWNTPQERAYAQAGDWKDYYATASANGDSYAREASNVANDIGFLSGVTNHRLVSLITDHLPRGKTCEADNAIVAQKMEAIRKALAAARVAQLDAAGASPTKPVTVSAQSISDFHNQVFQDIAGGTTSSWGIPVFGGDLPGSNTLVHWCTGPACHP